LAARVGTLLVWIGEAGVRLYSAGQPGGARADRLLYQAKLALDPDLRLKVVRKMYATRFNEEPPQRRSVEQLRGIEGARVREMYKRIAAKYGVEWKARNYDTQDWDAGDIPNRCLSAATSCLYGVTEAAVLAAGYAPAVGFVPVAFRIAARKSRSPEQEVRLACRDAFRETRLLERIIPGIEDLLAAGGIDPPEPPEDAVPAAIPNPDSLGDAGHRA
jgi:CRISPR-associated protein Cas1